MRSGTGIGGRLGLPAIALAAILVCAATPDSGASATGEWSPATTTALRAAHPRGAAKAATVGLFVVTGTPAPSRLHAYAASGTGRLTLTSPEGIAAPPAPAGACTQDTATQVSCSPGAVGAIVGDLQGGSDTVTTDPALTVAIGIRLAGPDKPMAGAGGRDRILGAAEADLIEGGPGRDIIQGNDGTEVLRGGGGRDALNGGGSPDALYGGRGPDKLNGGPGRDLCLGGGGRDRGRSCTFSKTIP